MDRCGPDQVVAIIRDVTEQRQLTIKLGQMSQHAQTQVAQIESLQATLRDQAIREPLTGLFNRPYFVETLERELTRAMRDARPISLVVIDIDAFKAINDTHGLKAGNLIVQELANILRDQTRLADIACRFADEYVVVLPGAGADIARQRAEQWRLSFETLSISFGDTQLHTTLSAGVAVFPFHGSTVESLLRAAENSLAAAKDAGCNRVVVWHA
jgi:diguanylate cyclase (GGDEF)-like protein